MDTGGLAQMSYNNFPASNGLGVPNSGFASRGKGSHIKRLSFEPTKPADIHDNGTPTPRTSRSHLLAGLRTAPKSATTGVFPNGRSGLDASMYADKEQGRAGYGGAKTSIGSQQTGYNMGNNMQMYAVPEQPLAPPQIQIDEHGQESMDPNFYAQLVATNMYLAEQQQRLQQQLIQVQQAAQQFQGLNLGQVNQMQQQQQFATPPVTPSFAMYQQQQMKAGMQQLATQVPGAQPGIYSVYDPMTGQQTYYMDQSAQLAQYMNNQQAAYASNSPSQQVESSQFSMASPVPDARSARSARPQSISLRSISPPKKSSPPPQDHAPLPPPSAGAFRRGHGRGNSTLNNINTSSSSDSGPKSSMLPKSAGFSASTPLTGTFGPGAARAGEHPIRQPRGPPSLDELRAAPTTRHEGSKNFATRQRRSAVHNLVKAGMERRRAPGSGGSMTPVSEVGELSFSMSSDNDDSDSQRSGSGSLDGRPSLGSSRTSVHGAIGSDRPSSREKQRAEERKSLDSNFTTASVSSEDGVGGSFAAVFKNGGKKPEPTQTSRKAPMLVLTSAEKRKNSVY